MSNSGGYTVDRKRENRRLNQAGDVEVTYSIYATTTGGTYFHVEVPEGELDQASERLAARARELDSIK